MGYFTWANAFHRRRRSISYIRSIRDLKSRGKAYQKVYEEKVRDLQFQRDIRELKDTDAFFHAELELLAHYLYDAAISYADPQVFDARLAEGIIISLVPPYLGSISNNTNFEAQKLNPTEKSDWVIENDYPSPHDLKRPLEIVKSFNEFKQEFLEKEEHVESLRKLYFLLSADEMTKKEEDVRFKKFISLLECIHL